MYNGQHQQIFSEGVVSNKQVMHCVSIAIISILLIKQLMHHVITPFWHYYLKMNNSSSKVLFVYSSQSIPLA